MRRIRDSFKATVKTLGWINGPLYLLTRGLDRISGGRVRIVKYDLAVQPLGEGFPLPYRRSAKMELRELREGDPLLEHIGHPAAVIAARFRQGGRCLAAVCGDELAGFLWWVEGAYEEDEVRCRFVPAPAEVSVWDFDVYVAPSYRGGMVFARLWGAANHDLSARGFRQSCSRISAFKPESLAAHGRLGARVVSKALFFCVGGVELMFATRYPWMHLSLSRASRPALRVGS